MPLDLHGKELTEAQTKKLAKQKPNFRLNCHSNRSPLIMSTVQALLLMIQCCVEGIRRAGGDAKMITIAIVSSDPDVLAAKHLTKCKILSRTRGQHDTQKADHAHQVHMQINLNKMLWSPVVLGVYRLAIFCARATVYPREHK